VLLDTAVLALTSLKLDYYEMPFAGQLKMTANA
jgi:hypothetical protein